MYLLINWVSNGFLLSLTIVVMPISHAMARSIYPNLVNRVTSRLWLWPAMLLVGLFASLLFCYLATSNGPALRVKNGLYFYFLACWLCIVHSLIRHGAFPLLVNAQSQAMRLGLSIVAICVFLTDHNVSLRHLGISQAANTVVQAYRDWLSGV